MRGLSSRAGLPTILCAALPRMQSPPLLSGLLSSPVIATSLSPSTLTVIPQSVGWQFIGHIDFSVRTADIRHPPSMRGNPAEM